MLGYKENVVFYCSSWIQGDNNSIRSGDSKKKKNILLYLLWDPGAVSVAIFFKKKKKKKRKKKKNSAGMVRHTKHEAEVQFKPSSNAFSRNTVCLNAELNLRFGSAVHLNLGLNFGPVLQSSGSNFGSGLNFGNTTKSGRIFHIPVSAHGVLLIVEYQETNAHGKWVLLWRMEKKMA